MRYDRNFAFFAPHFEWYTFTKGIGYVPTAEAPEEAIKAMEEYNRYSFGTKETPKPKKD